MPLIGKHFIAVVLTVKLEDAGMNVMEMLYSKIQLLNHTFYSNQLTERGMHDHEGYKFCDWCHETLYVQRVNRIKESAKDI